MLTHLNIRNYAIIREVDIALDPRLNIITGETGAGKSILMGALSLILGERADTRVLMSGEDKCVVEGTFKIDNYNLSAFFAQNDLDYDDTCIIRREINSGGKSRAFVNDTPVTLNLLRELGSQLVDIVSQHETYELNEADFQLSSVDSIADTSAELAAYTQAYHSFRKTEHELKELVTQELKARQDEDYLEYVLHELNDANIVADEQEELERNLDILTNAESIQQAAGVAHRALDDDESSVAEQLRGIKAGLTEGARHHAQLNDLVKRLDSCLIELRDVASEMENIAQSTHADPGELMRINTRLQTLFNLQRKHHVADNRALLELLERFQRQKDDLGSMQEEITEKERILELIRKDLSEKAQALSAKRVKAISTIGKKINDLLVQVEMADAKIRIDHRSEPDQFSRKGIDHISFQFAANKGSQFLPLNKVASGGELSRLMLCIKSLVSDRIALPTIVFDEIDTGISGEAALRVAQVMKGHAARHQVLAITHLPQIAGKADTHFFVYKSSDRKTTNTLIRKLNESERVEEIARMLHGENPSEKILEAARELIR